MLSPRRLCKDTEHSARPAVRQPADVLPLRADQQLASVVGRTDADLAADVKECVGLRLPLVIEGCHVGRIQLLDAPHVCSHSMLLWEVPQGIAQQPHDIALPLVHCVMWG